MKGAPAILLLAALWSFTGCAGDPHVAPGGPEYNTENRANLQVGVYQYTGFNREGRPVVRGYLMFARIDTGRVVGRWELRALVDTARIGPQHGRGTLVGDLRHGTLSIDLNPNHIDNNVILHGRLRRGGYAGRWQWIGFPGVINAGSFTATSHNVRHAGTD